MAATILKSRKYTSFLWSQHQQQQNLEHNCSLNNDLVNELEVIIGKEAMEGRKKGKKERRVGRKEGEKKEKEKVELCNKL